MMKNTFKKIVKTSLILIFSISLFSCDKDDSPTVNSTNDTYLTAKIMRNGKVFDYKDTGGGVIIIKSQVNEKVVMENLISGDENTGYQIQIGLSNRQTTNTDLKDNQRVIYTITKKEDGKKTSWLTSALFGSDGNQNPKGKLKITKETDSYIEGTFSFKGELIIDKKNIIEVTKGKFKAKKSGY